MAKYNAAQRLFTKGGRTRARREKMAANMAAQENSLFMSNTKEGRQAYNIMMGKTSGRNMTQAEQKSMNASLSKEHRKDNRELSAARSRMKNAKNDKQREAARQEMRDIAADMRGKDFKGQKEYIDGGRVEYGAMDRVKAAGTMASQYYFGGTGKQTAARIGGTVGGIVGLNVGLDALDDMGNSGGGSGQRY